MKTYIEIDKCNVCIIETVIPFA